MNSRRWLFSPAVDTLAFLGSTLAAALVAWLLPRGSTGGETPPWAWLTLVLALDVSHVWSTLFRVYLDGEERHRRALLYTVAPVVCFALGVAAYSVSSHFFWRVLAYVAAWHFVRQQVGWVVLYGRRAKHSETTLWFDRAVMYAATLGPLLWWHSNLPRNFWWFVEDDFAAGLPHAVGVAALWVDGAVLLAWLGYQLVMARREGLHLGKLQLVVATQVAWFGGIVLAPDDLAFTVLNVTLHGVPYLTLLYRYGRARDAEGGYALVGRLIRAGVPGFMGLLVALAWLEELGWDRLVWHDHPQFFGASGLDAPAWVLMLVVPLLATPQTTHYLLDGSVWRTSSDPNLAARLGWRSAAS
jgi:hypothetical protein